MANPLRSIANENDPKKTVLFPGIKPKEQRKVLAALNRKITQAIDVVRLYRNWPMCFLYYLRLLRYPEVTYVMRNGIKFTAGTKDLTPIATINEVWLHQVYAHLKGDIERGHTVVDIGAYIGSFSVFAATRAEEVKVYCYEPSAESFHFLLKNMELNNLKNVKAFQLAVSGERGKVRLYINEKHSSMHSTVRTKDSVKTTDHCVEVNSVTLDDILDQNEIDECNWLKMDCEGAEYEILLGTSERTLSRIRNISLEYHRVANCHINNLEGFLQDMGFNVERAKKARYLYARRIHKSSGHFYK